MLISVRSSVRPSGPSLSRAVNLHQRAIKVHSESTLRAHREHSELKIRVIQSEPKILRLVLTIPISKVRLRLVESSVRTILSFALYSVNSCPLVCSISCVRASSSVRRPGLMMITGSHISISRQQNSEQTRSISFFRK